MTPTGGEAPDARPLTVADVVDHVGRHVFAPDPPTGRDLVGIELEWLTGYRDHRERLSLDQAQAVVADLEPLPRRSRLTIEPGGQLELSSPPAPGAAAAIDATATDLFVLDRACAQRRIDLYALGADPVRAPERVVTAPRYELMEAFFDRHGRAGRTMMCNTASLQVNVSLGADPAARWRLANRLGPVLIAAFANSPFADGGPSGWRSTRLRAWWTLDPWRSMPVDPDGDPVETWSRYALDAHVLVVRREDRFHLVDGLTLGGWIAGGHELGPPTRDDLEYHLTTLFPPVRPRGWLELRMIDALPTPFWQVAVAVTAALLREPAAASRLEAILAPTADLWVDAAQLGLGHPALHAAALDVFGLAVELLEAAGDPHADLVALYLERWVGRGRCPGDDQLDRWRRDGSLFPHRESPVPHGADALELAAGRAR